MEKYQVGTVEETEGARIRKGDPLPRKHNARVGQARLEKNRENVKKAKERKLQNRRISQYSETESLNRHQLRELLKDIHQGHHIADAELDFLMMDRDVDGDGVITADELDALLNIWHTFVHQEEDLRLAMETFDRNRNGVLDKKELRALMISINGGEDILDEEVDWVMAQADVDGNKVISVLELRRALAVWYATIEEKEERREETKKSSTCSLL
mmetsp:Transcript_8975/g.15838  ORF Transcript_8975/g.15838 Transcript_8975/m.15838 type:complete len:214 (+) Transcript_8975:52-693(+)